MNNRGAFLSGCTFAVGVILALACGGGSSGEAAPVVTPIAAETIHDYLPYFSGNSRGVFVTEAGTYAGEWTSTPGRVHWGDSVERWVIAGCSDGQRWAVVEGYESRAAQTVDQFYRVEVVAQIVNGASVHCPNAEGVYLPVELPESGAIDVEAWFLIHAAPPFESSTRPGYWRGHYEFGQQATNNCWRGANPITRRAIVMREAWWTESDGWLRGSAPNLPWWDGRPVAVAVHFDFQTTIARDAGILWTSNAGLCLQHVERTP